MSRLPLFLAIFCVALAVGATLMMTLPKVYRAEATLLVENSQIPRDLASSTVSTDLAEQVQVIQQRLMTRENLLDLAYKFDLFANQPEMQPDEIVAAMRERIEMKLSAGRGRVTTLSISAEADNGQTAADIVNEIVSRALGQDAAFRTEIATDTLAFFEAEVARLGDELDGANKRILDFKNANVDALPETEEYRLGRQSLLQERLTQARREIGQLTEQRRKLVELFETTGRTVQPAQRALTPAEQELASLRSQLRDALSVFSESNPKVTVLKSRIALLESELAGTAPAGNEEQVPGESVYRAQLVEIDSQLESLESTAAAYEQEIGTLQDTIERTPTNAITLSAMERDRENIQIQYNTAVSRLSTAATGERIEVLSKGQRLSVIERAVVPNKPAKPSRLMIAAGSVGGGIFLGFVAIVLRELLKPTIRQPAELTRKLGITPLGTLPFVETPGERWRNRSTRGLVTVFVVVALIGGLMVVDRQVISLDQLAQKIIAQTKL